MTTAVTAGVSALQIRLGPGEDVCGGIAAALARRGGRGGVVVSAVGSLAEASYVLVRLDAEGRPAYTEPRSIQGAIEVLGLHGHYGEAVETGELAFHLHGTFGLLDGTVVGGHLLAARVLVTFEATLLVGDAVEWRALPYEGRAGSSMLVFVPAREAVS
jgi:predicted DNA-binding protein with PD1-like motif